MRSELIDNNPLLKLSFEFSILIIDYCEHVESTRKFVISKQLLKSETSIGANAIEAQNAEGNADFIHKIKIAANEADETQYWLLLCNYSKQYSECTQPLTKLEELNKMLGKILSTAKRRNPFSYILSF